ncbi:stage III sporulation protein AF [Jeotgalibacillus haloalkalitolerans]|uniref:Stage III sporulation protein AF n=1 Tax=Jeotgalibacillus haloalkalitolerans TaxID=3104292 RepID=A0ABU5KLI5_9BACL|nr:stage III sporulation protein AF [Jeotgalibacillus sp. HH7-29]MDZ5712130.1 stage III sporulation protein AF [Jeotgalibacillus sp. HH7-29]
MTEWAAGLAVLILMVLVADILTPTDAWRPFIRFTAGLIFLFWFMNPVRHLINDAESFTISFPDRIEKWVMEEKISGEAVIESMSAGQTAYILEQSEQSLHPLVEETCRCEIQSLQIISQNDEFRVMLTINPEDKGDREKISFQVARLLEIPEANVMISE